MIHSTRSQGCIKCIDYTDGSTFRANLNGAKDACECLPYEADDAAALARGSSDLIPDTEFDMTVAANEACKCIPGKYTIASNGLKCLECAASAGFLDAAQLTDCRSATAQCEPRGFSSVAEDTTDADNPTVRCGCDTSKNFYDNVGAKEDKEGCYCYKGDNWWTLVNGEYIETDGYVADIDYSDLSHGVFNHQKF